MNKRRSYLFAVGLLVLILACTWIFSSALRGYDFRSSFRKTVPVSQPAEEMVLVTRVVDGDTIEIADDAKVRYIGMNAPESVRPDSAIECFGKEAAARNKELVEGKQLRLTKDVSERDRYGRLLRFAYLSDGTLVNELLVREGYARVSSFPPDVSKQAVFRAAEKDARAAKRGLWADGVCPRR
jgi:endonuclease YncB( thermonuclease family)